LTGNLNWAEFWDRLQQVFLAIALDLRECDLTLFFEADHFQSDAFPFRAYANYSGSPDREEMVLSFDCWRGSNVLRLTADVAKNGRQIIAEWGPAEVPWSEHAEGGLTGVFGQLDAVEEFFRSCLDVLRSELCPDDVR
jgi:hypothetical protein